MLKIIKVMQQVNLEEVLNKCGKFRDKMPSRNRYFDNGKISMHTFINVQKSLGHVKNSVTLPSLKLVKFYSANKRR